MEQVKVLPIFDVGRAGDGVTVEDNVLLCIENFLERGSGFRDIEFMADGILLVAVVVVLYFLSPESETLGLHPSGRGEQIAVVEPPHHEKFVDGRTERHKGIDPLDPTGIEKSKGLEFLRVAFQITWKR